MRSQVVLNLFETEDILGVILQYVADVSSFTDKGKELPLGLNDMLALLWTNKKFRTLLLPSKEKIIKTKVLWRLECLAIQIPGVLSFFCELKDTHPLIFEQADMWNVTTCYRCKDPVAFVSSSNKGEYYIYDPGGNSTLSDVSAILRSIKCGADIPRAARQIQIHQEELLKTFFVYRIPFFQKLPCLLALFFSAIALSWKILWSWEPKGNMEKIGFVLLNALYIILVESFSAAFAIIFLTGDLCVRELSLIIDDRNIRSLPPKLKTGYENATRFFKKFEELGERQKPISAQAQRIKK